MKENTNKQDWYDDDDEEEDDGEEEDEDEQDEQDGAQKIGEDNGLGRGPSDVQEDDSMYESNRVV